MRLIRKALNFISQLNTVTGVFACFLILPLIYVMTHEVVTRYFFGKPTSWSFDLTWMIYGAMVFLGAGYTHLKNGHVRVDVVYNLFPERVRAGLEVLCYAVLFFPIMYILVRYSYKLAHTAWILGETSPYALWKPPTGPIKTVLFVGLLLLLLQGVVDFLNHAYFLVTGKRLNGDPDVQVAHEENHPLSASGKTAKGDN